MEPQQADDTGQGASGGAGYRSRIAGSGTMSRHHEDKGRLAPFIPITKEIWESKAWRRMSTGARLLYIALRGRYIIKAPNNGHVYLSTRKAAQELGSDQKQVRRWYRELQHYGFIVQTRAGSVGLDGKGEAPHWRLTELPHEDVMEVLGGKTKYTRFSAAKNSDPIILTRRKALTTLLSHFGT
jgi:hypothetical protein